MIHETERLIRRPFTEDDDANAYEYLHEPTVYCFEDMRVKTLEEAKGLKLLEKHSDKNIIILESGEQADAFLNGKIT